MNIFRNHIEKCVESCKCKGELKAKSDAEVLVHKLCDKLDELEGGFGYTDVNEIAILPETSFEISDTSADGAVILSDTFHHYFEVGKDYAVTLDGVTNTYTAIVREGYGSITNTSALDVFKNGNGWMLSMVRDNTLCFVSHDASLYGTHTISITDIDYVIKKIERKYLPDETPLYVYDSKLYYDEEHTELIQPLALLIILNTNRCYIKPVDSNYYCTLLSVFVVRDSESSVIGIGCTYIKDRTIDCAGSGKIVS